MFIKKNSKTTLFVLAIVLIVVGPDFASALKLKWGILSAGHISFDFIKSMKNFDSADHEVKNNCESTRQIENVE